ncbi:MAG: hypothetical protein RLZZ628_3099 [Bacteroidota bacterium]|jgi:hypothetical protein
MKINYILILLITTCLTSCDAPNNPAENEDKVQAVANKDGSIETELTTEHLGNGFDIIVTKHRIWNNNLLSKEVIYKDTVRALGKMSSQSNEGNTAVVDKDYEFYITVK